MHLHSHLPFPDHHPPFPMRPDLFHPATNNHDPAAPVDFRTFYPYTPNEVKHRKRTTSAQLKILEDVFKRDTKPNAQLRSDLASQLDMTPRGVQVWFQNRRAKEKNKASKLTLSKAFSSQLSSSQNDPSSIASPSVKEDPSAADEIGHSPAQHESSPEVPDASATPSATGPPSPPQLQVITDPSNPSWNHDSADDLPPDSASSFVPHSNPFPATDLYSFRRGSLPVNAFPSPSPERDGPPSIDAFDPLARRRSVDASLQRLANNPYAPLARAKNGALFGPRYGVVPPSRYNSSGRSFYGQRPGLVHHATTSHYLDMRRSSMDPRAFRMSSRGNLSPSPSPLSPYHGTRASLPDHSLYSVASRPLISPIPGPLPSPHFSFGDASTPSMTSPSSGESERNSPDSLRSFPFRSDERDEDDPSVSYDAYSRFGSIASIAASESSLHSAYYSDIGGNAVDADLSSLHSDRHDSCTPGQFLGMVPGLDSDGQQSLTDPMPNTLGLASYGPQADFSTSTAGGGTPIHESSESQAECAASYPSPASTISPGGGSPHAQESQSASTPPSFPISRTSELAFALQGRHDQAHTMQSNIAPQELLQSLSYPQDSPSDSGVSTSVPESSTPAFYYPQHADNGGQHNIETSGVNAATSDFNSNYGAECDPNVFSSGHFGPAGYDSAGNSYSIDGPGDQSLQPHHHQQHQQQQHPQLEYPQVCNMPDIYASYSDPSSIDNTISGIMENYISYT